MYERRGGRRREPAADAAPDSRRGDGREGRQWRRANTLAAETDDDDELLNGLFPLTLARLPRAEERAKVKGLLKDTPRDELFRDLFWALLNSEDFLFNY